MARFGEYRVSLAGKLIIAASGLMCAVGVLFSLSFYHYEKKTLLNSLSEHARFASDVVMGGLHYGMLTGQMDSVRQTVSKLGQASDISRIMIYDRQGRIAFSSDPAMVGGRREMTGHVERAFAASGGETVLVDDPTGNKLLKYLVPIPGEPSCFTSACHYHGEGEKVLGVLEMDLKASTVFAISRKFLVSTVVFGAIYTVIISGALVFILYVIVTRPLGVLADGMRRLARGDLDRPIEIGTKDEMGLAASTFNSMAQDIKHYRERMEDWAGELQRELDKKTREIRDAQEHLAEAEKLASLGRLAAGVAHELNSPLTGILSFAHLMRKRTPPDRKDDIEDLDVIIEQTNRCAKIIKGLLGFARKGTAERMHVNLNDLLLSTISMVRNQSKFYNIKMPLDLREGLPKVFVDPNQIQQVFINLLTNASDAMDNKGTVAISSRTVDSGGQEMVEVEFEDTGHGIIPDHMGRIFEPFFTTKPVGMGTGLGLPVSYGIIKKHGGEVLVRSAIGKGTSFRVQLPAARGATKGEAANEP